MTAFPFSQELHANMKKISPNPLLRSFFLSAKKIFPAENFPFFLHKFRCDRDDIWSWPDKTRFMSPKPPTKLKYSKQRATVSTTEIKRLFENQVGTLAKVV